MTPVVGSVVLSNLAYLAVAIVAMVLLSAVVVLRQRKPKSMEANVESFTRGLRALAPTGNDRRQPAAPTVERRARPVQILETTRPERTETDPG